MVTTGAIKPCKAPARSSPPTNQHPAFLQAGCPSCRPTNSVKALKRNYFWKLQNNKRHCVKQNQFNFFRKMLQQNSQKTPSVAYSEWPGQTAVPEDFQTSLQGRPPLQPAKLLSAVYTVEFGYLIIRQIDFIYL